MFEFLSPRFNARKACPYLDADDVLLPEIRLKTAMEWLEQQDIETLDTKTRLALFAALKSHVYFSADQNQYIQTATYEDPEFGSFTKPSIDESKYGREIGLMHALAAGLTYTPHMQDMIAEITEAHIDEMLEIQDFTDDFLRWPFLPLDAKCAAGWGYGYVFTEISSEVSELDIENTPFYPLDKTARGMPYFSTNARTIEKLKDDAELLVFASPEAMTDPDPVKFFGLLLHEKIHTFCANLAKLQARHEMDWGSRLAQDAELAYLRHKFRTGDIDLINSLYFADTEERLCYRNQRNAEERLKQLTPARQLTHSPATQMLQP